MRLGRFLALFSFFVITYTKIYSIKTAKKKAEDGASQSANILLCLIVLLEVFSRRRLARGKVETAAKATGSTFLPTHNRLLMPE